MRPHRRLEEIRLENEAEIEAALQDALSGPIDRLLALEEFRDKNEPARPIEVHERFPDEEPASTLAFPQDVPETPAAADDWTSRAA